ncbi:MAG: MBL fold metallo-hydrolase [Desulfobacterales bacterium]
MDIAAQDQDFFIKRMSLGPYGTNAYIIVCMGTKESAVVDAPGEPQKVHTALQETFPKFILMTHHHMDHTGALAQLKSDLKAPVAAHASDAGQMPVQPDILLKHGDDIRIGNLTLHVLHTPGHTPGSICFYRAPFLISGDTIFPGGPGKTWSPASFLQIKTSIEEKIFVLPEQTRVFPGHGEGTRIGKEKEAYRAFSSKPHPPDLCGDVLWRSED